jgi:divalent metal cation (Fe/Co/Zn/Cd) transporter
MVISIVIDVSRSRALARVAKKTGSQALEADALHFSTDVWSSSVVILGLAAVRLAPTLGMPWLLHADAVAALGVAMIVVWVSLRLGRRTIADLLDEVPPGLREQVEAAARVSGVVEVGRVRVRRSGGGHFVDLTVSAEPGITLERAHVLADRVEHAVQAQLPGADVLVHVEPVGHGERPLPSALGVQTMARRAGLEAHAVHLVAGREGPTLELHLEVEPTLDVATAHARAGELETKLRRRFPGLAQVVSHIEPRCAGRPAEGEVTEERISQAARQVATARGLRCEVSDVAVARGEAGLEVSFSCATEPQAAISEAHALTSVLESALRERFPVIDRITIHLRPLRDT